jgi:hypothetical protein
MITADMKKYTKEPVVLTPKERNELQSVIGPKIFEQYQKIMDSSGYKLAKDTVPAYTTAMSKQKILNRAMNRTIDIETAKWLRAKGYKLR